jgi:hypothetical protein
MVKGGGIKSYVMKTDFVFCISHGNVYMIQKLKYESLTEYNKINISLYKPLKRSNANKIISISLTFLK